MPSLSYGFGRFLSQLEINVLSSESSLIRRLTKHGTDQISMIFI